MIVVCAVLLIVSKALACDQVYTRPYDSLGTPDYYWRLYNGVIPHDAVQGGCIQNSTLTYIGLVPYPKTKALIPANIIPGDKMAVSAAEANRFTYGLYVHILCSQSKQRIKWLRTSIDKLNTIDAHLIIGGTEIDKLVYIGRAKFEGQTAVGKVFDSAQPNKGLWLHKSNGGTQNFLNFEVLVYEY